MTLGEFSDKIYVTPNALNQITYVFEDEDSADAFADKNMEDCEIFMTIQSQMKLSTYAKPEICNRQVEQIYAFGRDVLGVVIGG